MAIQTYITTSWDDGHPFDLRLAELLCKYGVPATFYVPLANELPLLTPSQVRQLSADFEIGAHTVHHCDLLATSDDAARREITDSKRELEDIIGRPCTAFCFPQGHFRRRHLRQVREAGYRMARTVELMSLAKSRICAGVSLMPTTLQAIPVSLGGMVRNSLKRMRPMNLLRYFRYRRSAGWAVTAEALLDHVLKCGGVFHLWGHSWEIAQFGEWENLERVLAILRQYKGRATFLTNTELAGTVGLSRN